MTEEAGKLREEALARDGHRCQFCGGAAQDVPLEVHHVEPRGMGGRPSADRLENLITLCARCHRQVHDGRIRIEEWDPLRKVLRVVDAKSGKEIPERKLWFHAAQKLPVVRLLLEFLRATGTEYWKMVHNIAHALVDLDELAELLPEFGYSSAVEAAVELVGLTSTEARRLIRGKRALRELEVTAGEDAPLVEALPLDVAPLIVRWPREEQKEILRLATQASRAELLRIVREKRGGKKPRVYRIFAGNFREVEAFSDDEVEAEPGAVVIRGGTIVRGGTRGEV